MLVFLFRFKLFFNGCTFNPGCINVFRLYFDEIKFLSFIYR